jgi:hypothetical protein
MLRQRRSVGSWVESNKLAKPARRTRLAQRKREELHNLSDPGLRWPLVGYH